MELCRDDAHLDAKSWEYEDCLHENFFNYGMMVSSCVTLY